MKSCQAEKYSYSFLALNRGLALTITFLGILVFLSWLFNSESYYSIEGIFIGACIWGAFFISHIFWDFKIKPNHKEFFLSDSEIIFIENGKEKILTKQDIVAIEKFPLPNQENDNDYIENMMSSGYRIIYTGGKFLIFSKIRNSNRMKNHLLALSCPKTRNF